MLAFLNAVNAPRSTTLTLTGKKICCKALRFFFIEVSMEASNTLHINLAKEAADGKNYTISDCIKMFVKAHLRSK